MIKIQNKIVHGLFVIIKISMQSLLAPTVSNLEVEFIFPRVTLVIDNKLY